jgi:NADH-quinone oxidoreductase subunit L
MRKMGGLARAMPLTCICYGVATLAIAGIYPFAGYFSKHAILGAIQSVHNPLLQPYASTIGLCATLIAICTAFYMTRSFILTFTGTYRGEAHAHEAPAVMTLPVAVLAVLSLVGGFALNSALFSYLGHSLPHAAHGESGGFVADLVGSLPGVLGIALAYILFIAAPGIRAAIVTIGRPLEKLFAGKYFVDELLDRVVVRPIATLSRITFRSIDQVFVEGSGNALGSVTRAVGELTCRLTTGQVATYLLYMFAAVALMISVFVQVR